MRAAEDRQLVLAVQAGDTDAYGELFERYQSRIYNFTYGILGNADDARDVTQDAFVKVFEALPGKERVDFSAYLYKAARNAAYDVTRSRKRYDGAAEDMDFVPESSMYADPERTTLFAEQQSTVRGAMASLSEDHRAILMLREVQELSYQEIADALDMTRTNVGVTIMRARLKFKGAFRMSHVDVDSLCAECQAMLPKLSAYLDDELKPEDRAKVEAHLDDCPLCRWALDEMREASKSYRMFVPLVPPEALRAEVLWRLSRPVEVPIGAVDGPALPEVTGGAGPQTAGDGAPATKAGRRLSTGARMGIGIGVLVLVAAAIIGILALGPQVQADALLDWDSWRVRMGRPIELFASPDMVEPEPMAEEPVASEPRSSGGSASGGSPGAPVEQPPVRLIIPPLQYYIVTITVPPTLY